MLKKRAKELKECFTNSEKHLQQEEVLEMLINVLYVCENYKIAVDMCN
jgi:hypothetical protein